MSEQAWKATVTAVAGLAILLILRVVLTHAINRYVERASARRTPDSIARLRTRLVVLRRVVLAFVFVVVVWSVLEIFPSTEQLARTLLASGAVVALFIGVAFSIPLGNIGAGILLSISQPVRLGDRISVGDVTGLVDEITLLNTVVRTDEGRTAFVPNSQMVTSTVVNRSLEDRRRRISVRLPIGIMRSVEEARGVLLQTAAAIGTSHLEDASVLVDDVGERVTWLVVTGYSPQGAEVERVAAELREHGLAALAREGLLPA